MASQSYQRNREMIDKQFEDFGSLGREAQAIAEQVREQGKNDLDVFQRSFTYLNTHLQPTMDALIEQQPYPLRPDFTYAQFEDYITQMNDHAYHMLKTQREIRNHNLTMAKRLKHLLVKEPKEYSWDQGYGDLLDNIDNPNYLEDPAHKQVGNTDQDIKNVAVRSELESSRLKQAEWCSKAKKESDYRKEELNRESEMLNRLYQDFSGPLEKETTLLKTLQKQLDESELAAASLENEKKENEKVPERVRRVKWWCCGIGALILVILALVLGLVFGLRKST